MLKSLIGTTTSSNDFTSLTPEIKTSVLQRVTLNAHRGRPAHKSNTDIFYLTKAALSFTIIAHVINIKIVTERIQRLLVPKFYHDRKDTNFLKGLKYFGEKAEIDEKYFYEAPLLGRKLYEYRVDPNDNKRASSIPKELGWPFPEKFYESTGYTSNGFSFEFKNASSNLRSILNAQVGLISIEIGFEEADNNLKNNLFNPVKKKKKKIEEKIAEYIAIPTKNFINGSYFLYHKSNLIKKHLPLQSTSNCRFMVLSAIFQEQLQPQT